MVRVITHGAVDRQISSSYSNRLLCVPASAIQLVYVLTSLVGRARCSSVVRVFTHGAVDRQTSSS